MLGVNSFGVEVPDSQLRLPTHAKQALIRMKDSATSTPEPTRKPNAGSKQSFSMQTQLRAHPWATSLLRRTPIDPGASLTHLAKQPQQSYSPANFAPKVVGGWGPSKA